MKNKEIIITEDSIKTELQSYKDKPYKCLFEYVWNSFDAWANIVNINYKLPKGGIWYIDSLEIIDNGKGWNFDENKNTDKFLSSTKSEINSKNRTLPVGKLWRWRFSFIWVANSIQIHSWSKKIILTHTTKFQQENVKDKIIGTKIYFEWPNELLTLSLVNVDELKKQLILEYGWFLCQNSSFEIKINWEKINAIENIRDIRAYKKQDFSEEIRNELDESFKVDIILWKEKPSEWSNFYFLNNQQIEIFKSPTGLNKKSDNFWHSVYIMSNIFSDEDAVDEEIEITTQQSLDLWDKGKKKLKNKIKKEIKEKLILLRKPYLIQQSENLIRNLEEEKLTPNLPDYGIYDKEWYNELLKQIYIISPSLFVWKNDSEVRFICATFAGLLSFQDNHLIQIILEQLQELSEEEKTDLLNILERTKLTNVIKTIKEIDNRLEVIDKLKVLISNYKKETLEVKHIQKILDENFWIFGEQFRLFSTTEWALKSILIKYAIEILWITDPELESTSNCELDLFLTKTEQYKVQRNIIIEIKRPSVKLTQAKEYTQLDNYRKEILKESICNWENQYWEFYLVWSDYDEWIADLIDSNKQHWEKEKWLTMSIKDWKVKMYVRKWSDILEVELWEKMKYLKEKLEIKVKDLGEESPDEITKSLIDK